MQSQFSSWFPCHICQNGHIKNGNSESKMHLCGQIPRKKGALEIAAIPGFLATVTYHEKYNLTS